jgi:site-specific DNA-methyltransferase (adenine-specific)
MVKLTLVQGDCLKYLPKIPDESIDLILTDPPFFMKLDSFKISNKGKKGKEFKFFNRSLADLSVMTPFFSNLFYEFQRVIKDTSSIYIFCDGQTYPLFWYYLYPFTKSVRPLIWDKKVSIVGYLWRHQHELIAFGEMCLYPKIKTGDGDIIRVSTVKLEERIHPAQKPVELLKLLILKSSKENDVVLDPFLGSGTTMLACLQTNRNCIGIEIEPKYTEICKKRLNWGSTLGDVEFKYEVVS